MSLGYTAVTATDATASAGVASSTTSFSPAAGSMVVVLVSYQFASSGEAATITCKDSNNNSYTAGPQIQNSYESYISALFTYQYTTAPGSITVSVTSSNTTTAYALIQPVIVTGQATSQSGAATATADPSGSITAISTSITTTQVGSLVFVVAAASNGVAFTPLSNTATLSTWTAADAGVTGVTSATTSPGATTVGWTCSAASTYGDAIAALEILPSGGSGGIYPNGIPGTWTNIFNDTFTGTALTSSWTVASGNDWSASGAYSYASNLSFYQPGLGLTMASSSSGVQIETSSFFLAVGDCCEAKVYFPGPSGGAGNVTYNWPAWWAAGPSWPTNGEIDIAEGLGDVTTGTLTVNYHDSSGNYNGPNPGPYADSANSYHTYGMIRNSTSFQVYYDGVEVYSYSPTNDDGGPMALLLDISSGTYGGPEIYGTASTMKVEYVRAWTPSVAPGPTTRSQYAWPFAWNACWNVPISTHATYAATGITSTYDYSTEAYAVENNSVSTSFPTKTFNDSIEGNKTVYCDPQMTGAGVWNDTCAFLDVNGDTVWQGQTLQLTEGGSPSIGGDGDYVVPGVSITTGTGNPGAHGGSSLSCLGGTITEAEMVAKYIPHAMKVLFNGLMYYSSAGSGWQWPAANADGGYNEEGNINYYGGSNVHIVEGALLALPPSINVNTRYSDPLIIAIATAMQNYGAYICDNTASGAGNPTSVIEMNYNAVPYFTGTGTFNSDLLKMYGDLEVVTNSTQTTPGGGAYGTQRLAGWAPPFTAQPALSTLTDTFATNDLSSLWANTAGTVTWSTGQVAIKCDTAYDSHLGSTDTYDLVSSSIVAKISPYVATSSATNMMLQLGTGNNFIFGYSGGDLVVLSNINGGAQTELFSTAYNATAHAWWRIRENSGTTYFDTAPDGATWTNQFSCADYVFGFPLTQLYVLFQGGDYGSDTAGYSYLYYVSPAVSTAKIATLVDNFAVNDLATLWDNSVGNVVWSTGQVSIECDTAYDSSLQSTESYDLTSSATYAKVAPYIATYSEAVILLQQSSGNGILFGYSGGALGVYVTESGVQSTLFTTTYSATSHAWWRVRESSGTTYFDTAPDGSTWTNQYSTADTNFSFALTSLQVVFQTGNASDLTGYTYVYAVGTGLTPPVTAPPGLLSVSII